MLRSVGWAALAALFASVAARGDDGPSRSLAVPAWFWERVNSVDLPADRTLPIMLLVETPSLQKGKLRGLTKEFWDERFATETAIFQATLERLREEKAIVYARAGVATATFSIGATPKGAIRLLEAALDPKQAGVMRVTGMIPGDLKIYMIAGKAPNTKSGTVVLQRDAKGKVGPAQPKQAAPPKQDKALTPCGTVEVVFPAMQAEKVAEVAKIPGVKLLRVTAEGWEGTATPAAQEALRKAGISFRVANR